MPQKEVTQMKKKKFCIVALISVLLTGCNMQSKHIDNPELYGEWESYLKIPSFLPKSINDYWVNNYSYTLDAYFDICYEIFLDLTVTEDQFTKMISETKAYQKYYEKEAYYCDGYSEIVFMDFYEVYHRENETSANVGWADIEKVIYNSETLNIIYVCFHANDTGVYDLDKVAYFNRFSINEEEYVKNLNQK